MGLRRADLLPPWQRQRRAGCCGGTRRGARPRAPSPPGLEGGRLRDERGVPSRAAGAAAGELAGRGGLSARRRGAAPPRSPRGCWGVLGARLGAAPRLLQGQPGRRGEQSEGSAPAWVQCGFAPRSSAAAGTGGGKGAELGSPRSATPGHTPRAQHPPCATTLRVTHLPLQGPREWLCPGSRSELRERPHLRPRKAPTCPKSCSQWMPEAGSHLARKPAFPDTSFSCVAAAGLGTELSVALWQGLGQHWQCTRLLGHPSAAHLQVPQHGAWGCGHQERQQETPGETCWETAGAAVAHTIRAALSG